MYRQVTAGRQIFTVDNGLAEAPRQPNRANTKQDSKILYTPRTMLTPTIPYYYSTMCCFA